MNIRSIVRIGIVIGMVLLLAACAGPNTLADTPDSGGHVAGFLQGLFNGLTVAIAWIISLFTDNVQIYDVHNNGGWYDFGFFLGIGGLSGGGGAAVANSRK